MSYQIIIIEGNLGKDPELTYSQSGVALCKFSIAVGDRKRDGDNWVDHTEWFNVVCFEKTAENCSQYLSKGKKALVQGKIEQRKYKDKDGIERLFVEVKANQVVFLSAKNEGGGGDARGDARGSEAPRGRQSRNARGADDKARDDAPPPDPSGGFIDDDLPF